MRLFQNAKDNENQLQTSLFSKEKKNIFVPFLFFEKSKKYLEIILKYTLCPGLWTDGHTHRGTERKIDEDSTVADVL